MIKNGKWTSFITRQTEQLKRELIAELGGKPTGRQRVILESIGTKYGLLLIMQREVKRRAVVTPEGEAASLVGKNVLAWMASLERSLEALFSDREESSLPRGIVTGIEERFRTPKGNS